MLFGALVSELSAFAAADREHIQAMFQHCYHTATQRVEMRIMIALRQWAAHSAVSARDNLVRRPHNDRAACVLTCCCRDAVNEARNLQRLCDRVESSLICPCLPCFRTGPSHISLFLFVAAAYDVLMFVCRHIGLASVAGTAAAPRAP